MATHESEPSPTKKFGEWSRIEDWALVVVLVIVGWEAMGMIFRGLIGSWFMRNEGFCFGVWIVQPFIAFRLQDARVRARLGLRSRDVWLLREAMLAVSIAMSVGFLFHVHPNGHTPHWYDSGWSWGLGLAFLVAWVAMPVLTWFLANHALNQAKAEEAERIADRGA